MEIGQRVRINFEVATVRYIGEVDGYGSQRWVGLEWDDPTRGKHDGIVRGKRYFQTRLTDIFIRNIFYRHFSFETVGNEFQIGTKNGSDLRCTHFHSFMAVSMNF